VNLPILQRTLLFLSCFLTVLYFPKTASAQAQPTTYAITHAKIFTLSGATIDDGTIVIQNGKNFGDPRSARHGNMFARREYGFGGDHVGIELTRFRRINRGIDGADLAQAHLRNWIE